MKNKELNPFMVEKYETQLLQNFEFYKTVFELSKDPKLVLENCKIVRFNPITTKFFECEDPADIHGHKFSEFFVNEEKNNEFIEETCTGNLTIETELKTCKGNVINVSIEFDSIGHNGAEKTIATIHDITKAEKDREWLEVKSIAVKALPMAVIITDKDGIIEWVNPAFTKIYGYTEKESKGKNTKILNSGKHDKAFYKKLWNTILAGKIWIGQIVNKCKDGTEIIDNMVITPVYAKGYEITHFIAFRNLD